MADHYFSGLARELASVVRNDLKAGALAFAVSRVIDSLNVFDQENEDIWTAVVDILSVEDGRPALGTLARALLGREGSKHANLSGFRLLKIH